MCGISGFIGEAKNDCEGWRDILKHRGPDDCGSFRDSGVALFHTRLSIIDVSAAARQPMANEDETKWLVCNGEIYNAPQLRESLERKGHSFRSASDNEVLVHLFEEYGISMLPMVRGMFAFALYDRRKRELFLARDRFGIKPLVYAHLARDFYFASEIKAISQATDFPRIVDQRALELYRNLNYIPAPYTIWRDVKKIKPGHFLKVRQHDGSFEEVRYDREKFESYGGTYREAVDLLEERLQDSVKSHLLSDVPVGALLSGGLDSSLLVAMASKFCTQPMKTFTISYPGTPHYDESRYARMAARHIGTDHTEIRIGQEQAMETLQEIIDHLDEPFADSSLVPYALVSKAARAQVKVVLSGDGGDELFAGYSKYQGIALASEARILKPLLALAHKLNIREDRATFLGDKVRQIRKLSALMDCDCGMRIMQSIAMDDRVSEPLREEIGVLVEEAKALGLSGINLWLYVDSRFVLPYDMLCKSDIASMRYGLEVRVPFVDPEVYGCAFSLPGGFKLRGLTRKLILRQVARRYLPSAIINRQKQGFGIPLGSWMRGTFQETCRHSLQSSDFIDAGLIAPERAEELLSQHDGFEKDRFWEIWNLFVLANWWRRNL